MTESIFLTAERVRNVVKDCMYEDGHIQRDAEGEPIIPPDAVVVEGITLTIVFDPINLRKNTEEIKQLLRELPDDFHVGKGEGQSFLVACNDRHGKQWGEHSDIENLVLLGLSINQAQYCLPTAMWRLFPGGVPYFVIGDLPDGKARAVIPTDSDVNGAEM